MIDATPLLRTYSRWRGRQLARLDPAAVQERELLKLVRRAARTRFGRDHGFDAIRSVADFQARVPVRSHEALWTRYWQPSFPILDNVTWPGRVPYFAVTSGTTSGKTKYIPVTPEMIASNKRAAVDVMVHHLLNHPAARPLSGKTFMLGGSTDLVEEAPGVLSGDLSGIAMHAQSAWMRPFGFPPTDIALIADWEKKLDILARRALDEPITVLTGTPSWMLILFDRMEALSGDRPPLPRLELVVHGGVSWDLYRARFRPHLERSGALTREVYPASEGFIASADRGDAEGLRLYLDTGLFLEFVPLEDLGSDQPTRHWAGTIETGVDYAVVISSCAGIFACMLGDTVRFVDRDPPRLLITGRTSYMLSAFGEHLIGDEIDHGIEAAAAATGRVVTEYTVGPVLPDAAGHLGHHRFIVEVEGDVPDAETSARFADALDRALSERNDDYRAHRTDGTGMGPPDLRFVPPGAFRDWMRLKGKLGGQHKVPRVMNDPERFAAMCREFGMDPD
ncbi:MAG: GH3 auxin-responsive promoter family protein [Pseudomonadota bacterium]|nr:GH3 auxin-responsive promoter family protein [Pseudomonadota bacterium]